MRVALWLRVSTPEQTVENQEPALRAYAASHDWEIVREFRMEGISGWKEKANSAAVELALSQAAEFDILLLVRLDRLTRQGIEVALRYVRQFKERGVRVQSIEDESFDTRTGELMLSMKAWLANEESDIRSERVKASVERRRATGQHLGGGRRPYGYLAGMIGLVDEEVPVIKEATRRVLTGESLRAIVKDFNSRGIKSSTGGTWHRGTLRAVLRSGRISGQWMVKDEIGGDAQWPSIISKMETLQLRKILEPTSEIDESGELTWTRARPKMLLSGGLIRCAKDGRAMSTWSTGTYRTYRCDSGCNMKVTARGVEELVSGAVIFALDHEQLAQQMILPAVDDKPLLDELTRLKSEREETLEDFTSGILNRSDRNALLVANEAATVKAEARLAAGQKNSVLTEWSAGDLGKRWDEISVEKQRAILNACLEKVIVSPPNGEGPRNRFSPSRVELVWRV